jgi:predicted Zn-dependent peptidase
MYKFCIWSSLLLVSICALSVSAQQNLKLPPFKKLKLPNGMTVVLVEQHETPIVDFRVLVRAGSTLDPPDKEGLAEVTAHLLIRGTKKRTAEQIATEIDFVGGKLEFASDQDFSRGNAQFLKKDIAIGLDLISDSLRNPIFPLAEVQKLLRQKIDTVKQEKDQAQLAIARYYDGYLFGNHPYGRAQNGDEVSLTKISRLDAMRFYHAHYLPGATTLVVAGDFATAEMERLIAEKFGDWKGPSAVKLVDLPAPAPVKGKRLLLVDKPDSTQTFFMFGNVGIARTNPDRIAIEVVNTVFGGRFTSMLNEELRTNTGLTYGASSFFSEQRVPGPFAVSTYTENSTTVEAIDLALKLLDKLHREGLSEEQLRSAKAYLKGQYPPQIETTEQLAELLAELDYYGLDEREVNDYFARIDAVTRADAERAIKQYFPLDDLTFVLIGKAEEIRDKVKKYAPRIDERKIVAPGFR